MRKVRPAAVLCVTLALASCDNRMPPPEEQTRAQPTRRPRPTVPAVPVERWRPDLRDAYRLRPDARFLLALGEIDRLGGHLPAPPGKAAVATFSDGKWTIRLDSREVGSLPQLPDFGEGLALLVAHAKAALGTTRKPATAGPGGDAFLMPGLLAPLRAAERSWSRDPSYETAARVFARLSFQMPDRLDIAPVIPARALALLAAVRARDPGAGVEEEVLLAHALGYTRHAENRARALPAGSSLRLFEGLEDEALWDAASRPGATEETRYLALRRATALGDLVRWRQARARFFPDNASPAVVGTGLDLSLPHQVEVGMARENLGDALPRAVLRELAEPNFVLAESWSSGELASKLAAAAKAATGPLWDEAALRAYYEAAYLSPLEAGRWSPLKGMELSEALIDALREDGKTLSAAGDTVGAPLAIERSGRRIAAAGGDYPKIAAEVRALVSRLDTRPADRLVLARFLHDNLDDLCLAEDLHRSLLQVLGEGSPKRRADSALYLGEWAALDGVVRSPQLTAPDAADVLWRWYVSGAAKDRLDAEYEYLAGRFPHDWNVTNYYVDFLRARKQYGKACEVGERWLRQNSDPRTPGYFHAHIRLAHGYVLAGEYAKGKALLEGMSESERFQKAMRDRGISECLVGMGRLDEAEKVARDVMRNTNGEPESLRDLVRILWAQGRAQEAAETLAGAVKWLPQWDLYASLTTDLPEVFAGRPAAALDAAVSALAKQQALLGVIGWIPGGLANAERWEDALRVTPLLYPDKHPGFDTLIIWYGYMKNWKGREAAVAWLSAQIPPSQRNPFSMKALYSKNDDLLWDLIGTPDPKDHPEWVWLHRACAYALRGTDVESRRAALMAYYQKDDDPDPPHRIGRYLLGLSSEAEMLELAKSSDLRSEVAYYLGVRAQSEKRFHDACEWYRVAAETDQATSGRALAMNTLAEWATTGQGTWKLEAAPKSE